jgi:hypothetical protein
MKLVRRLDADGGHEMQSCCSHQSASPMRHAYVELIAFVQPGGHFNGVGCASTSATPKKAAKTPEPRQLQFNAGGI